MKPLSDRENNAHNKMTKGNATIDAAAQKLELDICSSLSLTQLINHLQAIKSYDGPKKYNHTTCIIILCITIPLTLIFALIGFIYEHIPSLILLFVSGFTAIITGGVIGVRESFITRLTQLIHDRAPLLKFFQHLLFDSESYCKTLNNQFPNMDFLRGNHERQINVIGNSVERFKGDEYLFHYRYFQYQWTDEKTKRKSDGETETVYDTFQRDGIIIPFPFAKNIAILSDGRKPANSTFQSASIDFNRQFTQLADNEFELAKFLTPKMVSILSNALNRYPKLNLEINENHQLCLFFNAHVQRKMLTHTPPLMHTIKEIDPLITEINDTAFPQNLTQFLQFTESILIYADDNFDPIDQKKITKYR